MTQYWVIFLASALFVLTLSCRTENEMKNGAATRSAQEPVSQEAMVKATVEARLAHDSMVATVEAAYQLALTANMRNLE